VYGLRWDGAPITTLSFFAGVAAQLSFRFASRGFISLRFLHERAVAVRHGDGYSGRRMAGGCPNPARPRCKRVRQTVLVVGMAFGLAIFGAAKAHSATAALLWISLALGGLAAAAPVAWTVPSLISPRESVGTLAGAVNLCGQIAAISAPIVTGYIVSASHSFAAAFVTATVILLLGIVGYIFLLGRIEPIPEP
jgi:MFS family permease